jgi:hypothetical protein
VDRFARQMGDRPLFPRRQSGIGMIQLSRADEESGRKCKTRIPSAVRILGLARRLAAFGSATAGRGGRASGLLSRWSRTSPSQPRKQISLTKSVIYSQITSRPPVRLLPSKRQNYVRDEINAGNHHEPTRHGGQEVPARSNWLCFVK